MSNIISNTRRRSTSNFILPIPKPKEVVSDSDEEGEGSEDEEDDDDDNDDSNSEQSSEDVKNGIFFFCISKNCLFIFLFY